MTAYVATTGLSPDLESRINKRPLFQDLQELRSVEDDADTVIFLYREENYFDEPNDKGKVELIVAKNSEGHIGTIPVTYVQEYSRFENFTSE